MCAISYYSMLRSGAVTCRQLINAKDYPNIIRYYSLFDPQTIHISQSVFEQILPLVPEENKADRQLIQSGLDKCIQYKQKQTIPK